MNSMSIMPVMNSTNCRRQNAPAFKANFDTNVKALSSDAIFRAFRSATGGNDSYLSIFIKFTEAFTPSLQIKSHSFAEATKLLEVLQKVIRNPRIAKRLTPEEREQIKGPQVQKMLQMVREAISATPSSSKIRINNGIKIVGPIDYDFSRGLVNGQ